MPDSSAGEGKFRDDSSRERADVERPRRLTNDRRHRSCSGLSSNQRNEIESARHLARVDAALTFQNSAGFEIKLA